MYIEKGHLEASAELIMFCFFIWVVVVLECSLCDNSLSYKITICLLLYICYTLKVYLKTVSKHVYRYMSVLFLRIKPRNKQQLLTVVSSGERSGIWG